MKNWIVSSLVIGAIILTVIICWSRYLNAKRFLQWHLTRAKYEAKALAMALKDYDSEYEGLPPEWEGSGVVDPGMLKILSGQTGNDAVEKILNPRKEIFIDLPGAVKSTFDLKDPWGNRYEYEVSEEWIKVRSKGPPLESKSYPELVYRLRRSCRRSKGATRTEEGGGSGTGEQAESKRP